MRNSKSKISVLPQNVTYKKEEDISQTAHYCFKDLVTFGQCLGLFPLRNTRNDDPKNLKFSWLSFITLYSMALLAGFLFCAATSLFQALNSKMILLEGIPPLFYLHVTGTMILFIKITRNWPKFIKKIFTVDCVFAKKYKMRNYIRTKINLVIIISYIIVSVEHGFSIVIYVITTSCSNNYSGLDNYLRKQFHFVFQYFGYSTFSGIVLTILNTIGAYVWNFGDVFIATISLMLTVRFEQITEKVQVYVKTIIVPKKTEIKFYPNNSEKLEIVFWREIREDYNRISELCRKTDDLLSDIILLCYSCNLTYILFQLLQGLREKESAIESMYFYFSFGYVVLRTAAVSVFGGQLYEASKAPLSMLNAVPTEIYNEEISRLVYQIHSDALCLTGHNFFSITKGLVLSVAVAIITYELVLIQFNQSAVGKFDSNTTICF